MEEKDTAAMEQPTIAAATVVRMTILKTLCSNSFSIFSPAERIR